MCDSKGVETGGRRIAGKCRESTCVRNGQFMNENGINHKIHTMRNLMDSRAWQGQSEARWKDPPGPQQAGREDYKCGRVILKYWNNIVAIIPEDTLTKCIVNCWSGLIYVSGTDNFPMSASGNGSRCWDRAEEPGKTGRIYVSFVNLVLIRKGNFSFHSVNESRNKFNPWWSTRSTVHS